MREALNEEFIKKISHSKNEPKWMLDVRLEALKTFESMPLPEWGPDLSELKLDDLCYYLKPVEKKETSWEKVPEQIKKTFEKLGVPEHERKFFAGVGLAVSQRIASSARTVNAKRIDLVGRRFVPRLVRSVSVPSSISRSLLACTT